MKEFAKFEKDLDDQLKAYDISFFKLTHERLLKRIKEAKVIQQDIVAKPFDFSKDEAFNSDYESLPYVRSKKQMKERWRKQLKYTTLSNYEKSHKKNPDQS